MKKPVKFEFQTLGQLPTQDVVVGLATTEDGAERIFVIVLTEGLSINKRKEKLAQARLELGSNIINYTGVSSLSAVFSGANTQQTQAKVTNPENAAPLIQYMLSETERPIVVLDCQDKGSFWQSLRFLGVNHEIFLALAELEHLKPQHSKTQEKKSAGQAHLLCESIAKSRAHLSEFTKPKDLIEKVVKARKIRIPDIDIVRHINIAAANGIAYHRDNPERLTIMGMDIEVFTRIRDRFRTFASGIRDIQPSSPELINRDSALFVIKRARADKYRSIAGALFRGKMTVAEALKQRKAIDEEYERKRAAILADATRYVEDSSTRATRNTSELAEFEGEDSLFTFNKWGAVDINVRDGFHFLRHDKCLFEFGTLMGDKPYTVFVLASQKERKIEMQFLLRQDRDGYVIEVTDEVAEVVLDENMRMQSWDIYNPDTGRSIVTGGLEAVDYYRKTTSEMIMGYLAHIMDTAARMNDPDFEIVEIEPTGGKARQGKHIFPYFLYEVVQNLLGRARVRTISRNGGEPTRSSPVFHPVERHVRTYHRGQPDEFSVVIDGYLRGDPSRGIKGKIVEARDSPSAGLR